MPKLYDLQHATLAARVRCNDHSIGTRATNGRFDIIRVTYNAKGRSTVTPLHFGLTLRQAIVVLNTMKPEPDHA